MLVKGREVGVHHALSSGQFRMVGSRIGGEYRDGSILLPRDPAMHSISATTSGLFRGIF